MMRRFSSSNFAGTVRTEVAVGTDRDASMFCAMRAATPRRGKASSGGSTGAGCCSEAASACCCAAGSAVAATGCGGDGDFALPFSLRSVSAGAAGRPLAVTLSGGLGARRLIVLEEVSPRLPNRLRVVLVAAIHLVDEPNIRAEDLSRFDALGHVTPAECADWSPPRVVAPPHSANRTNSRAR